MPASLRQAAKAAVKRVLRRFGWSISRAGGTAERATMEGAFRALKARGPRFATVIDIGASDGRWSTHLMQHFPDCRYLLVEANPLHEAALRQYCARRSNAQFVLAAAGEAEGRIFFSRGGPFDGRASYEEQPGGMQVPVVSIDAQVKSRGLEGPYLLKFDTHGFEVPILKGASETLAAAEVIVMECYNFRIAPECLTFDEMCRYVGERGFRCIDLVEPLYRPHDDAFWQMDLVFVRRTRPEFAYTRYR